MNVSPALLSTAVLGEVQRRLEDIGERPWMEILLTSYCDWNGQTLTCWPPSAPGCWDHTTSGRIIRRRPPTCTPTRLSASGILLPHPRRNWRGSSPLRTPVFSRWSRAIAACHRARSRPSRRATSRFGASRRRSRSPKSAAASSRSDSASPHVSSPRVSIDCGGRWSDSGAGPLGGRKRDPPPVVRTRSPVGSRRGRSPMGVRKLLVGEHNSLAERMRRRRWSLILQHVPGLVNLQVVDLGGTAVWWSRAPVRPRHVTVVNLHEAGESFRVSPRSKATHSMPTSCFAVRPSTSSSPTA